MRHKSLDHPAISTRLVGKRSVQRDKKERKGQGPRGQSALPPPEYLIFLQQNKTGGESKTIRLNQGFHKPSLVEEAVSVVSEWFWLVRKRGSRPDEDPRSKGTKPKTGRHSAVVGINCYAIILLSKLLFYFLSYEN